MRTTRLITLAAVALAITSVTVPALAQSGGNDGQRRSRDREARATQSGDQGRQARGGEAARRQTPNANPARASGTGDRMTAATEAPARSPGNRSYATANGSARGADQNRSGAGSGANRSYAQPRSNTGGYDNRSNGGYDSHAYGNQSYGSQSYSNHAYDNRNHGNPGYGSNAYGYGGYDWNRYGWYGSYNRNAWHNQVHFGLGLSIFAGSPFSFRFAYGWQPGFRYRYSVSPGMAYGGMSFLLNPDYAEVYIDSQFVGVARDFGGQPVPVPAGYHRIELYAPGFGPVAFDINVMPGQVIPYRGSLYPVY